MELVDICLNYYVLWISFLSGIWSNLQPKKNRGGEDSSPPLPWIGLRWLHCYKWQESRNNVKMAGKSILHNPISYNEKFKKTLLSLHIQVSSHQRFGPGLMVLSGSLSIILLTELKMISPAGCSTVFLHNLAIWVATSWNFVLWSFRYPSSAFDM